MSFLCCLEVPDQLHNNNNMEFHGVGWVGANPLCSHSNSSWVELSWAVTTSMFYLCIIANSFTLIPTCPFIYLIRYSQLTELFFAGVSFVYTRTLMRIVLSIAELNYGSQLDLGITRGSLCEWPNLTWHMQTLHTTEQLRVVPCWPP